MKISLLVIFGILLLQTLNCKFQEENLTEKKKKKSGNLKNKLENATLDLNKIKSRQSNVDATISNDPNDRGQDAVAYNYDKLNDNKAQDAKPDDNGVQMKAPKIVDKLPTNDAEKYYNDRKLDKKVSPNFVDNGKTEYYNGKEHMKAVNADCKKYGNDEKSCLSSSNCGFCEDNKSCIPGTKDGPLQACKSYRYFADPTSRNESSTSN
ncbi:MAG: hypothetical protein ACK5YA_00785 [bacterium]|jgi:hypothetical protein